uniref:NADH-ubiquinone oxidoreductase chain 6 n=1 Tax=Onthophagus yukae TaxID=1848588 RepID=A0A1X9HE34_9SCAR|nr:NADH deshydrogenase subunit 6 [Onthophagus yukae]
MFKITMFIIMLTISMIMIWMKHPLSMGMMLLIQTINLSLLMGYNNLNYWFSYILFLIMIGGMLILFIYMTSIASNEKFYPSIKLMMIILIMAMLWMLLEICIDPYYINLNNIYYNYENNININKNLSMTKFFNFPSNSMMYLMIMYLLIALLAIVKITDFKKNGTLRSQ